MRGPNATLRWYTPPMVEGPVIGRRFSRLTVDLAVDCLRGGERIRIYTRDLSAGGFLYIADAPEKAGDEFPVILELATEPEALTLRALIRHSRPVAGTWRHQVGVEFVGLDEFTRGKLQRFIDRFSEMQKDEREAFKPAGLDRSDSSS